MKNIILLPSDFSKLKSFEASAFTELIPLEKFPHYISGKLYYSGHPNWSDPYTDFISSCCVARAKRSGAHRFPWKSFIPAADLSSVEQFKLTGGLKLVKHMKERYERLLHSVGKLDQDIPTTPLIVVKVRRKENYLQLMDGHHRVSVAALCNVSVKVRLEDIGK